MILEIDVAINYLLSHCYSSLDREKVDSFKRELSRILNKNYVGHWHSSSPQRGSAYRALLVSPDLLDPAIADAAEASEIPLSVMRKQLPQHLTIWVDPCEVSYRVGERGDVTSLWQEKQQQHLQLRPKEHKSSRKHHKNKNSKSLVRWKQPVPSESSSSSNTSTSSSGSCSLVNTVPPSPCNGVGTQQLPFSAGADTPCNANNGATARHPLTQDKKPTLPSALFMGASSQQTWCSLAAIDSKLFSAGTGHHGNGNGSDEETSWSTSTWDSCGSSVSSDDSGIGHSPIMSPLTTGPEDCKLYTSESAVWKGLFSRLSERSQQSHFGTDNCLSTKASRLVYTSQLPSRS